MQRLQLLRQDVLKPVASACTTSSARPRRVHEIELEQAVVAQHPERARRPVSLSTTPRYGLRSTRPSSARRFVIWVAEGALTFRRAARADVVARSPAASRA